MLIAPNPTKIYFVGLFAGFGIPFLILFLIMIFNKKVKEEDIGKITNIPVVGNIPRNNEKVSTIVFDYPNSTIAESFRLLRSRMQFFTKEAKSPVILITSSMPEEGKTFCAINLASAYSLLGKKTVLVGFDLRKPRIYQDFKLSNNKGVSTWLIGQDSIEEIIQKTEYENLHVIPGGPIPPNPSELTALDKTNKLINLLRERYEYIIVDSAPMGLVSDTYHIGSLADACLLVIKPGKTLRNMLEATLMEVVAGGIKGVSLVINDTKSTRTRYGYGEKFGYTHDKEKGIRRFFKKNKLRKS
jgi:capsular exopolysaccharide synthesis family protein